MRGPHNIWRLIQTGATLERTGAMRVVLEALNAPPRLRLAARVLGWPFRWLGLRGDPSLPPATRALTALGPAYIKFGQILSTRPDIVGNELSMQLTVLQDKLAPFPVEVARLAVEEEFGLPVDTLFSEFSEPVAAASIAQVHKARLAATGQAVAVKVLRPRIHAAFQRDIDAFHLIAATIEFLLPATRRLRPTDVIKHFESVVQGELDLRLEAASAAEFATNIANDEGFTVPRVHWQLSGRTVLTLDWVEGPPLSDLAAIDASGHDRAALGTRVLALFVRHALRDGYFHGDMHQGNLKLAANGDIVALDFGIMGRIDEYTRRVYAEVLYGFLRKDYRRIAELHFEAGYVPPDRDLEEFTRALRSVGEPIVGMDATRMSMAKLLNYLFETTERFGMRTRTELILLQRTMVVVEGVARSLDPQINLWTTVRPVVEDYIRDNLGPRAVVRDFTRTAQLLLRFGPRLPAMIEERLHRIDKDSRAPEQPPKGERGGPLVWMAAGAALVTLGVVLGGML